MNRENKVSIDFNKQLSRFKHNFNRANNLFNKTIEVKKEEVLQKGDYIKYLPHSLLRKAKRKKAHH